MTLAAPASRAAEILSRPVSLNGLTVPNRIVMAPMTRQFSPGGIPGEDVVSYYARRAAAGVGLIVTEGTYVGHESAGQSDSVPRFHGEERLAGWTKKLTGKPAITVGSVGLDGLDGEFLSAFAGEGAPLRGIDDLLDRLEAEEFDLVAVGRRCSRTRSGR